MAILTPERKLWVKNHKKMLIIIAAVIAAVLAAVYLYTHRPAFSASYQITGDDESRLIEIQVTTIKGNSVTMFKDKTFVIDSVAHGSSLTSTNMTETQNADSKGKAVFKIFPNELKSNATNIIHFKVRTFIGLSKNYYFTVEKPLLEPAIDVSVTDGMKNNEKTKIFSIITDPYNVINIPGLLDDCHTKTGTENIEVSHYDILKLAGRTATDMPDEIQVPVTINVTNVDGMEKTEKVMVSVSTATILNIEQPEDTESHILDIKGQAPPGSSIYVSGIRATADATGNFLVSVNLPKYGPNTFKVFASRPIEKETMVEITVNKLMPLLNLTVDDVSGEQTLVFKGTVTEGATVTVNGSPAVVEKDKYFWTFNYPPGISKKLTFTVKAEKPGHRPAEKTLTIDQKPVFREGIENPESRIQNPE